MSKVKTLSMCGLSALFVFCSGSGCRPGPEQDEWNPVPPITASNPSITVPLVEPTP
ncbi:hypothetical protein ACFXGA_14670 [Actinosynnema sp. NPDC059335]|uniref:hypothetical protein n=1 Tax=Actinosynnema sp. NPDC059335 TaxID=3346804 RepID=UPI00366FBEB3